MDEKDWIALRILSEEKNISRASERLYISQPALTYRLKNLEEEFGTRLFFKIKGGIEFTSEGLHLAAYAEEMIKNLQKTKDYMLNMQNEVRGTLRLGVSSNFAQYKLPKLLKGFSTEHPHVQFSVNTGWSTEIMSLLDSSSVQLGILRGNYDWYGTKTLLHKERLCLISKKEINMDRLPQLPFIQYKTDSSLKNLINGWWNDRFSEPPFVTMETDRQETCKEMVKNDLGIAILPEICLQPSDNLYTYGLSYKKGEPVLRNTWLMYNQDSLQLSTVKHFVDFLNNHPDI
ncbi:MULTISPECIES: LysR family transcriptional regulator [Metabacillus]|uniref:LysR family transcriptional regulator n=1 Tax=Metabacillus hrfriensis TaxID=3048891 RepID=A0ACD4RFL9_9BACI|nr:MULTISPECIES: LysR family transcriptional regulator [Metabacillus]UAL53639.1 LysR family transcriptional regulator [Metabacillus dongyingensis]USK29949.1 LysR family transcriptional regulator [Bacillus sp. CMF21]WHZ59191.1 LysR family transcriptional regulator [Metabacillus sp. CT-WN-B3]